MNKKETETWQVKYIVPFVVAFLATQLIFYFLGFSYSLFRDPFNIWLLIIDWGVFLSVLAGCYTVWQKLVSNYSQTARRERES